MMCLLLDANCMGGPKVPCSSDLIVVALGVCYGQSSAVAECDRVLWWSRLGSVCRCNPVDESTTMFVNASQSKSRIFVVAPSKMRHFATSAHSSCLVKMYRATLCYGKALPSCEVTLLRAPSFTGCEVTLLFCEETHTPSCVSHAPLPRHTPPRPHSGLWDGGADVLGESLTESAFMSKSVVNDVVHVKIMDADHGKSGTNVAEVSEHASRNALHLFRKKWLIGNIRTCNPKPVAFAKILQQTHIGQKVCTDSVLG